MSLRSCCGGFNGFAGTAQGFPYIWRVNIFVQFGFDKGVLQRVEVEWVRVGGGKEVGYRWRRYLGEGIEELGYSCGCLGGFERTTQEWCVVLFVRIEFVDGALHIFEFEWDGVDRGRGVGGNWREEGGVVGDHI